MRTLGDVVQGLAAARHDGTLYATRPWTAASGAVVANEEHPPSGLDYMLEVTLARQAVQVWSESRQGAPPSAEDACAAVVFYAEHDAFMPVEFQG
jgi:hypothetical protein